MTIRNYPPFNGKRYIGNNSPNIKNREVHDLLNEDKNENGCQIDEIKNVVTFNSLAEAHDKGFDNCDKCLGGSKR
jgi:hypothetical protein